MFASKSQLFGDRHAPGCRLFIWEFYHEERDSSCLSDLSSPMITQKQHNNMDWRKCYVHTIICLQGGLQRNMFVSFWLSPVLGVVRSPAVTARMLFFASEAEAYTSDVEVVCNELRQLLERLDPMPIMYPNVSEKVGCSRDSNFLQTFQTSEPLHQWPFLLFLFSHCPLAFQTGHSWKVSSFIKSSYNFFLKIAETWYMCEH